MKVIYKRTYGYIFKMVLVLSLSLTSTVSMAAVEWFTGVTVTRVMSQETSIQIWGDKRCDPQSAAYAQQTVSSSNSAYLGRMMSLALSAQVAGKTISIYADCVAGTIVQMCINNPVLDSYSC